MVGIECAKEEWTRVCEYCPYDLESRIYGHIPGRGHQTFEWVTGELKPYIDDTYRTSKAAVISPAIQPAMDLLLTTIRLSIGLEDTEDVLDDIRQALV